MPWGSGQSKHGQDPRATKSSLDFIPFFPQLQGWKEEDFHSLILFIPALPVHPQRTAHSPASFSQTQLRGEWPPGTKQEKNENALA